MQYLFNALFIVSLPLAIIGLGYMIKADLTENGENKHE